MKEFIGAATILWCIATYWLGGQEIPFVNMGFKAIRRFGLPLGLFAGLMLLGQPLTTTALACALLCVALHLGYKDKVSLFFVTGAAMGAPSLILSSNHAFLSSNWPVAVGLAALPCLVHTGLGWLSKKTNRFGWSWVALAMGWAIGVAYVGQV